jgi:Secretion system C-terminal sorting domain
MVVYPNPVKGSATIELPESGAGTVTLLNAAGRLVLQQEFSGSPVRLSVNGVAAGIYQLVVWQNGKRYQQEIFCQ